MAKRPPEILSFDFSREEFHRIPLPSNIKEAYANLMRLYCVQ